MLNTSETYQSILASGDYEEEHRALIQATDGEEKIVTQAVLVGGNAERGVFGASYGIGNAVCAPYELEMLLPNWTIARKGRIRLQRRIKNKSGAVSEWLPNGVFYVDTRKQTKNLDGEDCLTINGFDAMLMMEATYPAVSWTTRRDYLILQDICSAVGINLSSETLTYLQSLPAVELPVPYSHSYREVLKTIAVIRCGNFIMDEYGELKLVPLVSAPPETFYLIDEAGRYITFGGDRIVLQ